MAYSGQNGKQQSSRRNSKNKLHVALYPKITAIPIARKHEAASKGATGPRANVSTRTFPNSPATMATRPFPRNIAFENEISILWNQHNLQEQVDSENMRFHNKEAR
ncbi:hypothetical protein Lal_00020393, partial [Lupinus albus]